MNNSWRSSLYVRIMAAGVAGLAGAVAGYKAKNGRPLNNILKVVCDEVRDVAIVVRSDVHKMLGYDSCLVAETTADLARAFFEIAVDKHCRKAALLGFKFKLWLLEGEHSEHDIENEWEFCTRKRLELAREAIFNPWLRALR
jgi:hypothetical protein